MGDLKKMDLDTFLCNPQAVRALIKNYKRLATTDTLFPANQPVRCHACHRISTWSTRSRGDTGATCPNCDTDIKYRYFQPEFRELFNAKMLERRSYVDAKAKAESGNAEAKAEFKRL